MELQLGVAQEVISEGDYEAQSQVHELDHLQLAFVGGGIADVVVR